MGYLAIERASPRMAELAACPFYQIPPLSIRDSSSLGLMLMDPHLRSFPKVEPPCSETR
jgi:hypothetical protein